MPVVWQLFAQQHQVSTVEGADVIAHKTRSFTSRKKRQLHLQVVVPVRALTGHMLGLSRAQHGLNLAQVLRPPDDSEGVAAWQLNVFTMRTHAHYNDTETALVHPN